jgi:ABC-type transporter Mla MlaB component
MPKRTVAEQAPPRRIALAGEISRRTAAAVWEQLMAALSEATEIEVEVSQITAIDGTGLQVMIAAKRKAAAMAKTLNFTGHSTALIDALESAWLAADSADPTGVPPIIEE